MPVTPITTHDDTLALAGTLAAVRPEADPTGCLEVRVVTDHPQGFTAAHVLVGRPAVAGGREAFNAAVPGGAVHHFPLGRYPHDLNASNELGVTVADALRSLDLNAWVDPAEETPHGWIARGVVLVPRCINGASVKVPLWGRCAGRARIGRPCPVCGTVNRDLTDDEVPF